MLWYHPFPVAQRWALIDWAIILTFASAALNSGTFAHFDNLSYQSGDWAYHKESACPGWNWIHRLLPVFIHPDSDRTATESSNRFFQVQRWDISLFAFRDLAAFCVTARVVRRQETIASRQLQCQPQQTVQNQQDCILLCQCCLCAVRLCPGCTEWFRLGHQRAWKCQQRRWRSARVTVPCMATCHWQVHGAVTVQGTANEVPFLRLWLVSVFKGQTALPAHHWTVWYIHHLQISWCRTLRVVTRANNSHMLFISSRAQLAKDIFIFIVLPEEFYAVYIYVNPICYQCDCGSFWGGFGTRIFPDSTADKEHTSLWFGNCWVLCSSRQLSGRWFGPEYIIALSQWQMV